MIKIKRYLAIFIIVLVALGITARAFSYEADVVDISGNKYFPTVKEELSKAKESIFMVMFKVGLSGYDKSSSVYQLVDELVKAHKRGVKVTVILDQNIGFADRERIAPIRDKTVAQGQPISNGVNEWEVEGKNAWCFKMLKEADITVWYDDPTKYVHAKSIVIDGETVILGSANWTESALFRNFETNVLIKSRELAGEFLESFAKIKIDQKVGSLVTPVPISWKFLEKPSLAGEMMSRHDERSFDLYLLLLKDFDGNPKGEIILDYEILAKSLGFYERMSRTGYRRQIIKSLRKLEKRYNLVEFKPQFGKEAMVVLLNYGEPPVRDETVAQGQPISNGVYHYPEEWYFHVPANYWKYGWDNQLSMRAKFCYLINLAYASISDARPWWFGSRETLSKRFNVGKWMISKGMQELRRLNIIDVEYPPMDKKDYESRLAKHYKVLSLYDPAWLEEEWDRLEIAYQADTLKKAKQFAKIVFEENDPKVVEDIILKIKQYGLEKVKKAFNIVAKKNIDNPKRKYSYAKGIIEKMAEKEEGE